MSPRRRVDILLVEDSPSDVFLTRESFREQGPVDVDLHVVIDGVEAMDFLRRRGPHARAPRPDLVLLDLNLPRKDGREVLAEVKSDTGLLSIPIVVLTSSDADADRRTVYGLHANCYVRKPSDFVAFRDAMRAIRRYWFELVALPPK